MDQIEELYSAIEAFVPGNEEEKADRLLLLSSLSSPETLKRSSLREHFTASSWIVNRDRTKVVLVYHNIFRSWSWTGGHADGEADLLSVAMREAEEETGLHVTPVSKEILSLERLPVEGHYKRGAYVPSHIHLNVTYLLEADENETPRMKEDENSGARWVPVEEVEALVREEWMMEHIYAKLIERTSSR